MAKRKAQFSPSDITIEQILYITQGYLVPLIGGVIIILLFIFVYIPNVTGIFSDISNLQGLNTKYQAARHQIESLKEISNMQTNTNGLLSAANTLLPDQAKSADIINNIQQVASNDGVSVITATGNVLPQTTSALYPGVNNSVDLIEVTFHVNANSTQMEKLFDDISALSSVSYVSSVTTTGNIDGSSSDDITFVVDSFAYDSSIIEANTNLLERLNTTYQLSYITSL